MADEWPWAVKLEAWPELLLPWTQGTKLLRARLPPACAGREAARRAGTPEATDSQMPQAGRQAALAAAPKAPQLSVAPAGNLEQAHPGFAVCARWEQAQAASRQFPAKWGCCAAGHCGPVAAYRRGAPASPAAPADRRAALQQAHSSAGARSLRPWKPVRV